MSDNLEPETVNERKDYHNCELTFSFYYESETSDFKVNTDQKYNIHTTIKEVELLNEALNLYQENAFKKNFLLYTESKDPETQYPDFVQSFNKAKELATSLQALAQDEDSLVQLSEYCEEQAPTYADDFGINKALESIMIEGETKEIKDYTDLKAYLAQF